MRGVLARNADNAKQGLLLGIEKEAAAHKVDWKSLIDLEFRDSKTDPDYALEVVKEAVAEGAKAILTGGASSVSLKIQDYILDEAGLPMVVFTSTTSKLRTKHALFLRVARSIPLLSAALARWVIAHPLAPDKKKPRWACIHLDYVWGVGICDGFKNAYGETGEEIARIPVPFKTVNKKKEILQLAKLNPDFAVAAMTGEEAEIFFRDYYRFKVHKKVPTVSLYQAVTPKRLQSYEKTLDKYGTTIGLITASAYESVIDNPVNRHFVTLYQKAHDRLPDAFAMWGYDGGRLLIKTLVELDGQWDGEQFVQRMKAVPLKSPRHGQLLQFDTHSDPINPAYIQKTRRDGNRLVNDIIDQTPPVNMDEVLK